MYDNGGFMVLIPNGKGSVKSTPSRQPTNGKGLGEFKLIKAEKVKAAESDNRASPMGYRISGSDKELNLITQFKPKAWQHKAWEAIGHGIRWSSKSPFKSNRNASNRLKHVLKIGVAMKVKASSPYDKSARGAKPIITQLAPKNNSTGIYCTGTTEDEIVKIIEKMHEMMYDHVDDIVATIDDWGYAEAIFIMKAIVVYDDFTIDSLCGDPRKLFERLGISFDKKGKVKL